MKTNPPAVHAVTLAQLRKQFPDWTIRYVFGDHIYSAHRKHGLRGRLNFKSRNPLAVVVALTKADAEHFPGTKQPEPMEPEGGNLYRDHPLQITSGQFWRCAHGTTGFGDGMKWQGCAECAKDDPAHAEQIDKIRASVFDGSEHDTPQNETNPARG